jgi:transposase
MDKYAAPGEEKRYTYMISGNEKWSSIEEISEHIQVHKDTIRIWIQKGEIPAHKEDN